jgi:hypothetical protein
LYSAIWLILRKSVQGGEDECKDFEVAIFFFQTEIIAPTTLVYFNQHPDYHHLPSSEAISVSITISSSSVYQINKKSKNTAYLIKKLWKNLGLVSPLIFYRITKGLIQTNA